MDTYRAFKRLTNSGLEEQVAIAVVEIVDQTRRMEFEKLVTKDDLKFAIDGLRIELKEEIAGVRAELKEEIAGLRTELKEEIAGVRAELRETTSRLTGDLVLLKWMVGISISLSIAIIAKLFFN